MSTMEAQREALRASLEAQLRAEWKRAKRAVVAAREAGTASEMVVLSGELGRFGEVQKAITALNRGACY